MPPKKKFDVFLSHNSKDKAWVIKLKDSLEDLKIKVWLDKDEIRPGDLFAKALEMGIEESKAVALIISPEAMASGWVKNEYYRALSLATNNTLQLIPVLYKKAEIPGFLSDRNWIDFSNDIDYDENIGRLIWGITGEKRKKEPKFTEQTPYVSTSQRNSEESTDVSQPHKYFHALHPKYSNNFRYLLQTAIDLYSRTQHRSFSNVLDEINDQLGYGYKSMTIQQWLQDNYVPNSAEVEYLAKKIMGGTNLDSKWVKDFFEAAGYQVPSNLISEGKRSLRVFLCHASGDKSKVKLLYDKLRLEKNVEPWLDQEKLLPGQKWDLEIRKAVSETDAILVFLSKQSINKEGYVQKEIKFALDAAEEKLEGEIFLIPIKLEECDAPMRLSTWQWLNYFETGAYERLLQSLQKRADYFGIKIGNEMRDSQFVPISSKPPIKTKKTNANAGKIKNTFVKSNIPFFVLQNSMLREKATKRNIKNISTVSQDVQIDLFRETLIDLEEYLDTGDLRKLTARSLGVIRDDVLEIIKGLRNLQSVSAYTSVRSLDGTLEGLRFARDGLQVSLMLFDEMGNLNEAKSKKLFTELRHVREELAKALLFFRSTNRNS